jgi:hypothetical protein
MLLAAAVMAARWPKPRQIAKPGKSSHSALVEDAGESMALIPSGALASFPATLRGKSVYSMGLRIFGSGFTLPILAIPLCLFLAPEGPLQIGAGTVIDWAHGFFLTHENLTVTA